MTVTHVPFPSPSDAEINTKVFEVLRLLDGYPVSRALYLLEQARLALITSTRLNCASTDFVQAEQVFCHADSE